MTIKIEELKEMDESECNLWGSNASSAGRLVVKILKENNTEAFNMQEINVKLNELKNDKKIKKGSMYHIMRKILSIKDSNIHKKGSYYYYEKKGGNKNE